MKITALGADTARAPAPTVQLAANDEPRCKPGQLTASAGTPGERARRGAD